MEVADENQQTLADFLLLAQNAEKELADAEADASREVQMQSEKKPLLKDQDLKREQEERPDAAGVADDMASVAEPAELMLEDLPNFNEILPKSGENGKWMVTVDTSSSNSKPKRKSARITYYEEGNFFSFSIY